MTYFCFSSVILGLNMCKFILSRFVSFEGTGIDVRSPLAQTVSIEKARKYGYSIKNNSVLVERKPKDMKNKGFLPSNKRR